MKKEGLNLPEAKSSAAQSRYITSLFRFSAYLDRLLLVRLRNAGRTGMYMGGCAGEAWDPAGCGPH